MKRVIVVALVALFSLTLVPLDAQADWFVFTSAGKDQSAAQATAATNGGWVLDTDFYPALTPGLYAVVRGPFADKGTAQAQLDSLKRWHKDAYLKDGGAPLALPALGSAALDARLIAALLGELAVEVTRHKGADNPCEPQEPYRAVALSWTSIARVYDPASGDISVEASKQAIDLGGFWIIESTGEIDRMRVCME